MKQAIMTAPGRIELRRADAPEVGPGQVRLRVRRIGICGSDVHVYHGTHPCRSYPTVQGHEFCATVESVGEGVAGLAAGEKVTALPQRICGRCRACLRGDYHICDRLQVSGFGPAGAAQELFVVDADMVVPLPEAFSFEQGALVEPAAVAAHAMARGGEVAGRNVVVLGAGPIGNLVAQTARSAGAEVLITDLSDYRLDVATRCGVAHVANAVRHIAGLPLDANVQFMTVIATKMPYLGRGPSSVSVSVRPLRRPWRTSTRAGRSLSWASSPRGRRWTWDASRTAS
ncbi:hypothetical protein LCGC14_1562080 [marine sediment metagenome]|uniref:Alcohol dehydrogenase-like N-terminal domain-containing protein n=1 Tax=marine sediment metagenome TaxID=412755 RepID=A0A0F9J899_9ZZZZ